MNHHILIIDDDRKLRNLLQQFLHNQGLSADTAESADKASEKLMNSHYDLITIDVMMPGISGIEFTKKLKERNRNIPVLMLTAKGEPHERIAGLQSGADDYLQKPFDPQELYLRIIKLIERFQNTHTNEPAALNENNSLRFGDFEFNLENYALVKNGVRIVLSSTESELLHLFCTHVNQPIDRHELARRFNGISERSVDVQITRLRKKIETDPKIPQFLQTSRGKGYVFRV